LGNNIERFFGRGVFKNNQFKFKSNAALLNETKYVFSLKVVKKRSRKISFLKSTNRLLFTNAHFHRITANSEIQVQETKKKKD